MEIKTNKTKLILLFTGSILMTLCSIIILKDAIKYMSLPPCLDNAIARNKEVAFLFAIAGILFTMICSIYIIVKLVKNKPALIIEPKGFVDNSTLGALGFIEWKDVSQIKLEIIATNKFISVYVTNIDNLLHNKPWYVKVLNKANMRFGYIPISITLNTAKEKPEEVLAIMNKYWDEWKKNNEQ